MNMTSPILKDRTACFGTFICEMPLQSTVRIAAAAGIEFVIIDGEHGLVELSTLRTAVALCRALRVKALVRVPDCGSSLIRQALDSGAHGILAANVETADQARQLADMALFPPDGSRGVSFGSAQDDYSGGNIAEKMRRQNRDMSLLCMIESPRGAQSVDEIISVAGISGCWFGYIDFSSYAGMPGQVDAPKVLAAAQRVGAACSVAGKVAGVMTTSLQHLQPYIDRHFNAVAWASDAYVLKQGLISGLGACRNAMTEVRNSQQT